MLNILIVFTNYNGYRTSNNLREPRISVTIDSFRTVVLNYDDYDVLLLDTGSTDGSYKLLKKYQSDKWIYRRNKEEYYYLGSLKKILDEYSDSFKYILIVDNDQYFFREGFLETALAVMEENAEIVNIQLNEVTQADIDDKRRPGWPSISGVFDKVGVVNDEIWMRSTIYKKQKWWNNKSGIIRPPNTKLSRRACWMWWSSSNTLLRSAEIRKIFKSKKMRPPFKDNHDRLTTMAKSVRKAGRTAFLGHGGSINFGFRKKLAKGFDLLKHLSNKSSADSLLLKDGYSFFDDNGKLKPISEGLKQWIDTDVII